MTIPQTAQGTTNQQIIPYWIKNNAKWWADGLISDSDFVLGIQYLIKNGIMQVGPMQSQSPIVTTDSSQSLGTVTVNGDTFEKKGHQSIQVQITGKINDFKTGSSAILTIIRPDQSSFELKGILTNKGQFTIPLMIDANSPPGRYAILVKYNNEEVAMTSFTVK
jgi:hypothetical protein